MDAQPWITLQTCPGLPAALRWRLLKRYGSAKALIAAPPAKLRNSGVTQKSLQWLARPGRAVMRRCLQWLAAAEAHLVAATDPRYPPLLREIHDPPAALFVLGRPEALAEPQIGIVGSRSATPLGRSTAADFARSLSRRGLCIASGLAEGIDAAAHEAALECAGSTVAVCATGLDRAYPRQHEQLARRIAAQGALISENQPGSELHQWMFPRRNRIISGISAGVVVVEAGRRSGARITARAAAEQGREVFAVPGSIYSPLAKGCHALIRSGAKLVERPEDVLEELPPLLQAGAPEPRANNLALAGLAELPLFCSLLEHGPASIDDLVRETGQGAAEVSATLARLELQGRVHSLPGGRFQRAR